MADNRASVVLPDLSPEKVIVTVKGTSPLICHAWSEKAKKQMLAKQMKTATRGREAKDPEQDFRDSLYPLPEGGYGFPAIAFKAAMVRAGTYLDMKMTYLRGAFFVDGEMLRIEGCEPTMREDMVKLSMGVADIRYRGEFKTWFARVPVSFNRNAISLDQVINLARVAGFSVGVGEWRPERDGQFGRFEVVNEEDV